MAISGMMFESPAAEGEGEGRKLKISFYPQNVVKYLVESGNFPETFLRSGSGIARCLTAASGTGVKEVVNAIEIAMKHKVAVGSAGDDVIALRVIRSEAMRLALVRLNAFPMKSPSRP
jgi:hypothetical protein